MSAMSDEVGTPDPASEPPDAVRRLRLTADAHSVSAARRFVADALAAAGRHALVDMATLCVSELASNAVLHADGSSYDVEVEPAPPDRPGTVRIGVRDAGGVPAAAVVPRDGRALRRALARSEDAPATPEVEPTTGRGLAMVSMLASRWGVEEDDTGKHVWFELAQDHAAASEPQAPQPGQGSRSATLERLSVAPAGWHVVLLKGCPVDLALRHDEHLDELIRELQLIDAGGGAHGSVSSAELAESIHELISRQSHVRHTRRLRALEAAAAGLDEVDVPMPLPPETVADAARLHDAVLAAEEMCAREQLLTLASSPQVSRLREWVVHEIEHQLGKGEAPTSFRDWAAAHG
jgi:anti-sigma regulatory factor (Ser/Thr protein kinase)